MNTTGTKYRVLLAEDDFFQSQRMDIILKKNNFEVIIKKDGLSAFEYVTQNPIPDIIITDIHMPKMDGYELTAKIKKMFPEVFVLILTASAERDAIESAYAVGATDFVRKPVDSLELIARINNLIKLKTAEAKLKNALSELEDKNRTLKALSITDELTGLYNRRYFFEALNKNIYDSNRYFHPITLFMFDVDSFKTINDTYGHQCGDKVLCDIADILRNKIRKTDVAGRFGGDEFLVMFNNTDMNNTLKILSKLLQSINNIIIDGSDETVKVSGGLFQYVNGLTIDEFVAKTDSLLYKAKESGKNKIEY